MKGTVCRDGKVASGGCRGCGWVGVVPSGGGRGRGRGRERLRITSRKLVTGVDRRSGC